MPRDPRVAVRLGIFIHKWRVAAFTLALCTRSAAIGCRMLRGGMEDMAVSAPAPPPTRALLEDAFGSFGKVVAAVTGAGIFLYLIGVAVLWLRLAAAGLQEQEVIAAIPRDQVAVLGAREALLSTLSGILFALFLYAFFRLFRVSEQLQTTKGVRGVLARWMRDRPALLLTVLLVRLVRPIGHARDAVPHSFPRKYLLRFS